MTPMQRDPSDINRIGFWNAFRALGGYSLRDALWPEFFFALLIGAGGAVALVQATEVDDRASAAGGLVAVAAALLAVVFAALAVLVALPASRYLAEMAEAPDGGLRVFLDPFLLAAGTQLALIVVAVVYGMVAASAATIVEHGLFYLLGFLFIFGLLDVMSLARQLVKHAVGRAIRTAEPEPEPGSVSPISRRAGG